MPTIAPVAPSAVPDFPALSDRATYNARAYAWAGHMDVTYGAEMFALATVTKANADDAVTSASSAASQVALAAAQVTLAAAQVTLAQAQATAAASSAATAGAIAWVSGTTYAVGVARFSLINFQTYRRAIAGAGTTDPANDPANWTLTTPASPGATLFLAANFGVL